MRQDCLSLLAEFPGFNELPEAQLIKFLRIGRVLDFGVGDYLFHEHGQCSNIYLVMDGECMLARAGWAGHREVVSFLGAGYLLGFSNLDKYLYDAKALTKGYALEIANDDFYRFVDSNKKLKEFLRRENGRIILSLAQRANVIGTKKAHERLCLLLTKICRLQNQGKTIYLNMTRQDIADYLGLTSDTVSRGFQQLEALNLVSFGRSRKAIDIIDMPKIGEMVGIDSRLDFQ